jgi:hypothetical protein
MRISCHECESEHKADLEGETIAAAIGKISYLKLSFGKNSLFIGLFGSQGRSVLEIARTGVISIPKRAMAKGKIVPLLPGLQLSPHWVGPGQNWNDQTDECRTLVACAEDKKIIIETYWSKGQIAFGQLSFQQKEHGERQMLLPFQPEGMAIENMLSCDSVRFCPSPLYAPAQASREKAIFG